MPPFPVWSGVYARCGGGGEAMAAREVVVVVVVVVVVMVCGCAASERGEMLSGWRSIHGDGLLLIDGPERARAPVWWVLVVDAALL
jgi:hypothetical protein